MNETRDAPPWEGGSGGLLEVVDMMCTVTETMAQIIRKQAEMIEGYDGMTPQWATVLLSVLALAFSIYSGIRANGKTDRKDAEEAGKQESAVMMKLEVVQNTLLEVKQDIKSQKLEMEKMNERTIRNEESLKSLHKRVDRMEALLQLSPDAVTHETH